ncbi:uncharacterized protein LOC62_07G008969 [Vanrija pseudolonga]|uniref:Uncharacterized protein n=1 Tax=Vanrija pseudolonga TaxID=143232 RepID=A0AAF1BPI2_9TREE|nr:hypothetical protein LOC62_07G008969 [Vanrija pseudolonga]
MPRKLQLYRAAFCTGAVLAAADVAIFALCAERTERYYDANRDDRLRRLAGFKRAKDFIFPLVAGAAALVYFVSHIVLQRVRPRSGFLYTLTDAVWCVVLGVLVMWSGFDKTLSGVDAGLSNGLVVGAIVVTVLVWLALFTVSVLGCLAMRGQVKGGRVSSREAWFMSVADLARGEQLNEAEFTGKA